jgi:pimeloyl-ACP methyl ester carboxylesterase
MGRMWLKVVMAIGILLVVAIIASVWMVWKRPLKVDAMFSRFALSKLGFEKSRLATPDGHMTVWVGGRGPCMVLLHGAGDQAGAWARMVPPLLDDYRVVIPDLPGHWKSDPRKGPLGVGQVLSGVEVVMDSVCAGDKAILVGNSLGAWVAMLYAHDYPARVERLVAINGGAIKEENPAVNLFPQNREEARETMKGLMGPATLPLPDFVLDDVIRHARVGPAGRLAQTADRMDEYLLDGRLDEIEVPVELVWGDADQLLTLDYAQRLLDGLPRARLHTVHGCGHVPERECPDRTAEILLQALALPPPGAANDNGGEKETGEGES